MVRKVNREIIDEITANLLCGKVKYMSIYKVNKKKTTKYNIDYELHQDNIKDEITDRHRNAVDTLYEFINALEKGNVELFSFVKRGLNISIISSFKEEKPKHTIKRFLEEAQFVLDNSEIKDLSINIEDQNIKISELLDKIIHVVNVSRGE
jgi:hypothetical protein